MNLMTRRKMLIAIANIAAVSTLVACGAGSEDSEISSTAMVQPDDIEILASLAYDLFPYEALPPELYIKVANSILELNDPLVEEGLNQIYTLGNNQSWLEIPDEQRMNILTEIQQSDFFGLIRANTIAVIYSEPEFFDLVGYGGSAIEFGGYINRGFDDIDWLPEQELGQ